MSSSGSVPADTTVSFTRVTKSYGGREILRDVSFEVRRGETFGLIGANGAGKTTILRILLGLVASDAGTVEVFGGTVGAVAAQIGALVDAPSFYPWLSGRATLEVIQGLGGVEVVRDDVDRLLSDVGLAADANKKVGGYSRGMKQRLGLAAALLNCPRLLVLDEPSTGLDPVGVRDLRAILIAQKSVGTTIVLSSHVLDEVERLCDRIAIISDGTVRALGSPGSLAGGASRLRLNFSSSVDESTVHQALLKIGRTARVSDEQFLVDSTAGAEVVAALASVGLFPDTVELDTISLEDTFLRISDAPTT